MIQLDAKTIIGNKSRPWFFVFHLNINRNKAYQWFKIEPHVAAEEGLGDADYWALEFECGLRVAFEFFHFSNGGIVYATEPVPQHVARHLSHWKTELNESAFEFFEPERTSMIERFGSEMPELKELNSFQLWRQGDDGNKMKVGFPTSRRDAECWAAELESHKHKQIYWVSRVDNRKT